MSVASPAAPVMEYRGGLGWPGLVERGMGLCEKSGLCALGVDRNFGLIASHAARKLKKKILLQDCDGPVTTCTKFKNCDGISVTIVEYSVTKFNYFRRHCSSVTNKISPSQIPSQIVTDINSVTIFRHNFVTFL